MAIVTSRTLGVTLDDQALTQYGRAIAAGCPLGVTSHYRDPDAQARLFHENYIRDFSLSARYDGKNWGGVWYWRRHYNARTGGPTVSVAIPGTSLHEKGRALDLPGDMNDPRTPRGWMHAHGAPFGFYWPTWAQLKATREEWHLEFDPAQVTNTDQEDTMTPVQEQLLRDVLATAKAAAERAGRIEADIVGTGTRPTILSWLKARIGGSASSTITAEVRSLATRDDILAAVETAASKGGDPSQIAEATVALLANKLAN